MKMTFLGTNGWFSDKNGNTICTLLETRENYIVFDAGDGLHKLNMHITKEKPVIIFLSHLHLDHLIGLHMLGNAGQLKSLKIYCPEGTRSDLLKIFGHPFTASPDEYDYPISIVELSEGIHNLDFGVECRQLFHADKTFGYRLMIEEKIITHLCDTGACENANILAKNADIVIHECAMKPGENDSAWGHSGPERAALVAKESGAKKLFLTHLAANNYTDKKSRDEAEVIAKKIFENTICAEDDLVVEI
ncbi:MAG: seceted metal-dependent hydrolase [uncultured bacterium]|nr:MAG: seceted metal-dependent hydrolase [uncultured bacterium]